MYDDDWKYRRDLRETQKLRDAKPAISVPAPSANDDLFFPWPTDFAAPSANKETGTDRLQQSGRISYLDSILNPEERNPISESEDAALRDKEEQELFLAAVGKNVKRIK